jgi:WD40 repeat protein
MSIKIQAAAAMCNNDRRQDVIVPWQVYSYPGLEKLTVLNGHIGTVNTIALDATDRCTSSHPPAFIIPLKQQPCRLLLPGCSGYWSLSSTAGALHPERRKHQACRDSSRAYFGSRGRRWLVSGGADSVAAVWDLSALACVRACTQLDGEVKTSSISADSQYLAYAGDQDAVIIEALQDGAPF